MEIVAGLCHNHVHHCFCRIGLSNHSFGRFHSWWISSYMDCSIPLRR